MMNLNTLELEINEADVATLWLNRPERNNAMNAEMIQELTSAFRHIGKRSSTRLLVLRGRGRHFCAGADLNWMKDSARLSYKDNLEDAHKMGEMLYTLHSLALPTLAVVHGAAYAGGLGLVACCDMAVGTQNAQICLSEVNIGLIPAMISPFMVKAVGNRRAHYLAVTGKRIDGIKAETYGLLNDVCPETELETTLAQFIEHFLKGSPAAQKTCKALFHEIATGELSTQKRNYTEQAIAKIRTSDEGQEGLTSFLEKRPPLWQP